MSDKVYKLIELTGTSSNSIEDAVNGAIKKASETVHNMRWFSIEEVRGHIDTDHVDIWQVTVKVGFAVDD
jgi:flavin-binding protein dodecin